MKLIVGLGNHGDKYAQTRHNMGYLAADYIAEKYGFGAWTKKPKSQVCEGTIEGEKVWLLKPETYMNLSGEAVINLVQYYKIDPSDIIILSDDLDLDFGVTRFRHEGSDGGQKGLRDIFEKLGTKEIARVKFGINNEHREKWDTADFVLSKLSGDEMERLPKIFQEGVKKMIEHAF